MAECDVMRAGRKRDDGIGRRGVFTRFYLTAEALIQQCEGLLRGAGVRKRMKSCASMYASRVA